MDRTASSTRRSLADREGVLARAGGADRLADAVHVGARLLAAAVRALVRRRPHQPVPQRRRSSSRDARRPGRARLRVDRDGPGRRATRIASCTPKSIAARRSLRELGVGRGDRVLIYMPMIPEAVFAMLACVRIGAIHSVVFGGFAAASLATRIDDAKPKVMVTADAGMRGGKAVPYKHLVDEACRLAKHPPATVAHRRPRPRSRRCRARRAATSTMRTCARSTRRAACRASGSSRASRRTSSTRPAPPASRRACSATPAATRSRWRRRCATSSAWRRARRCSPPATSAGWSATRTSSTRRCSTARRRSCTRACRSVPTRRSGGRSSPSTASRRCSARRPRSAC